MRRQRRDLRSRLITETQENKQVAGFAGDQKPPKKANVAAQIAPVSRLPSLIGLRRRQPRQEGPQSVQASQTGEVGGQRPRGRQDRQGSWTCSSGLAATPPEGVD